MEPLYIFITTITTVLPVALLLAWHPLFSFICIRCMGTGIERTELQIQRDIRKDVGMDEE